MSGSASQETVQHEMVCPTCNARQAWSDQCRRCKTDLTLLRQIWLAAEMERRQCLRMLADGHPHQARRHARQYATYVGHPQAARLIGVCNLLIKDLTS